MDWKERAVRDAAFSAGINDSARHHLIEDLRSRLVDLLACGTTPVTTQLGCSSFGKLVSTVVFEVDGVKFRVSQCANTKQVTFEMHVSSPHPWRRVNTLADVGLLLGIQPA